MPATKEFDAAFADMITAACAVRAKVAEAHLALQAEHVAMNIDRVRLALDDARRQVKATGEWIPVVLARCPAGSVGALSAGHAIGAVEDAAAMVRAADVAVRLYYDAAWRGRWADRGHVRAALDAARYATAAAVTVVEELEDRIRAALALAPSSTPVGG